MSTFFKNWIFILPTLKIFRKYKSKRAYAKRFTQKDTYRGRAVLVASFMGGEADGAAAHGSEAGALCTDDAVKTLDSAS